ncbi:tyrosine-type recombinase/integrase [Microbispora sp. CA-135349]|uniref:tyrosine-type recombinase/integrase n=1 Tax=Microbispora sp. CA-135349 TaxID=3239953 RepID=UPI003D8E5EBE
MRTAARTGSTSAYRWPRSSALTSGSEATFDQTSGTRWRKARAKAGFEWLRLHDLPHACASYLLACGASPRTVMKTLGLSQIALTMNTYAHVLPDIERAAVDAVAKQLFG